MSRIEEIKKRAAEYEDADTNARLKALVEKHGIEEGKRSGSSSSG